jgi:hypothetical protein
MALPIFQRTVVNATGDIIPNAQVTVREAGTQTLATIYQDEGGLTQKSNPFITDSSGLARFYAAPQVVDVAVTAASGAISWIDIQLIDTQDITTIGSNFAAVETTAANIAAIIDAPNQAAIATTQAGIATTQAGIATTKASEAAASAASVNANNIVHAPDSGLPNELSVAANSVYGKSNILGTVSQSGGVPTGAIIERGSNANGEFVKYADGTVIAYTTMTIAANINAAIDTGYRDTAEHPVNYPTTFVEHPSLSIQPRRRFTWGYRKIHYNSVSFRVELFSVTTYTGNVVVDVQMIGRWY